MSISVAKKAVNAKNLDDAEAIIARLQQGKDLENRLSILKKVFGIAKRRFHLHGGPTAETLNDWIKGKVEPEGGKREKLMAATAAIFVELYREGLEPPSSRLRQLAKKLGDWTAYGGPLQSYEPDQALEAQAPTENEAKLLTLMQVVQNLASVARESQLQEERILWYVRQQNEQLIEGCEKGQGNAAIFFTSVATRLFFSNIFDRVQWPTETEEFQALSIVSAWTARVDLVRTDWPFAGNTQRFKPESVLRNLENCRFQIGRTLNLEFRETPHLPPQLKAQFVEAGPS